MKHKSDLTQGGWLNLNNPRVRSVVYQILIILGVVWAVATIAGNVVANLEARGIATGFRFLGERAGFGVSQALIDYSSNSTYSRVFFVGLLNTLLVSAMGIVAATFLGLFVGLGRLTPNWLVRKICMVYIEIFRNVPVLLQIFFWYYAVLQTLPRPNQSITLFGDLFFINVRGAYAPRPVLESGIGILTTLLILAIIAVIALTIWARRRKRDTGEEFPVFWASLGILVGTMTVGYIATGQPLVFDIPELRGFSFDGGMRLRPELLALWVALTVYTSTFIAEIFRSGIQSVSHGQSEAARALSLTERQRMKLVVLPQALRVIVPPLTSQYLNLTKNSSLAVAIGYPDLVSVFQGTALNQTGQAIEIVGMTMAVYLIISLLVSAFMNWFNKRVALVER
ncbi:MAG: amino acid ABC transporter permease [Natronospirillum sp.]|uniref:amino acid ABC transporter permease n=1 Tax=Natronospirillum sp. TaxID=2812955 RepID=UPI0025D2806A|nr:amino acid ABC transporter permease [Natronospirillum sp.]MCH8551155.1 amino acid ABC transporter permease [Natronospirillum sp.]